MRRRTDYPENSTRADGYGQMHTSCAHAGFPSPADDYLEGALDLNKLLVHNAPATFFLRVKGDSMTGAGIHTDDILVVDRSVSPTHNSIVVAVLNGALTVKRLWQKNGRVALMPDNPRYKPIEVTHNESFEVWGVATSVIHSLRKKQ
ncbi:LexA family protein [Halodesulfovibrio marinisediminis]|uniref:SOS response UmuD protein. Serine peptidase. MEROPS family S24 n=1 Tax=Halodesulfovibrio marinisediminis DSM 17456 TaxID=1121457 RepID=A0A1N6H259_9BACT|nr:translesion error-prone DNA polymerase V autoproteolytic subunit [Halodesulfovibrio marinisediminis]SIO13765.1 SOS response UmuD protein. Serine peptidase. MEROPS family S24 [Halodesulfovibrio marinisediminis DSM 17456]